MRRVDVAKIQLLKIMGIKQSSFWLIVYKEAMRKTRKNIQRTIHVDLQNLYKYERCVNSLPVKWMFNLNRIMKVIDHT